MHFFFLQGPPSLKRRSLSHLISKKGYNSRRVSSTAVIGTIHDAIPDRLVKRFKFIRQYMQAVVWSWICTISVLSKDVGQLSDGSA